VGERDPELQGTGRRHSVVPISRLPAPRGKTFLP
jgi:hypothetical protein